MTKRSVALVGVLVVMAMIGSSVIGAVSAWATSDAANGTYSVFLPLIMNAIGAMAEVPQGAVMTFNLTSCPSGWTEVIDAQGRAIVGLPSGGTLSGTVGGGLSNLEDRSHSHDVNPIAVSSSSAGIHNHIVNPPEHASNINGTHMHYLVVPPGLSTEDDSHSHKWTRFDNNEDWWSYGFGGAWERITNWTNGMDAVGTGNYPLSRNSETGSYLEYYTEVKSHSHEFDDLMYANTDADDGHAHLVDIPSFSTGDSSSHSHSVNIPNTSSTTASTSDVMPYIQFLVCEKD